MTVEEIAKLTPEERRVKIAEACGWRVREQKFKRTDGIHIGKRWEHDSEPCGFGGGLYGFDFNDEPTIRTLPDYLNNLNAMAKAETVLNSLRQDLLACHLVDIVMPGRIDTYNPERDGAPTLSWGGVFSLLQATAAQRAEAFLRTI